MQTLILEDMDAWEDDSGEIIEPDWSEYYEISTSDIITAFCGRELSRYI